MVHAGRIISREVTKTRRTSGLAAEFAEKRRRFLFLNFRVFPRFSTAYKNTLRL